MRNGKTKVKRSREIGGDIRAWLPAVKAMKTGYLNLRIDEFCE